MPIADICDAFPLDASRAYLAYAKSQSFVRFLRDTYGTASLQALVSAYADGLGCEQGVTRALNTSLAAWIRAGATRCWGKTRPEFSCADMLPYLGCLACCFCSR